MNPLPFLALAAVTSGYFAATEATDEYFDALPSAELTSYSATDQNDLSVYDVLAHGAQPVDEPHCSAHGLISQTLRHDFDEQPVELRKTGDGLVLQLWASDLMGSWTMVHKGDDGISCIIASGSGWTGTQDAGMAFQSVAVAG